MPAGVPRAAGREPLVLNGRVVDSQGVGMKGVIVEVRGTRPDRLLGSMTTDPNGAFSWTHAALDEPVVLSAASPDYATTTLGPLILTATASVEIVLRTRSEFEETVTVEGRGETVPLEANPDLTTFSELSIETLPLIGRQISDLLVLAPGITDPDGDGNLNVRGARDTGLQLRLDGTNVTNPLTGHFGQDINLETVQEVEVMTSGAPAEYGRADGGFANIITKSGGNDISGSLKIYLRSSFLDGAGADGDRQGAPDYEDTSLYATLGGPIAKDHLWYFGSLQRIDREVPVVLAGGPTVITSMEGHRSFAKITWQTNLLNKLTAQYSADPLEALGNHISPTIAEETDYQLDTGGPLFQIGWSSVLSPDLLLTSLVSTFSSHQDIDPVSDQFAPTSIERLVNGNEVTVTLPCAIKNCRGETGLHRFAREDTLGSRRASELLLETGPYPVRTDQNVDRLTLKSDLSYVHETEHGQHSIKAGFEGNHESYEEDRVQNPTLTDRTCEYLDCGIVEPSPPPRGTRYGLISLQGYDETLTHPRAEGESFGLYVQDAWKIRPNLVVNAGLRFDVEELDSTGRTLFDPLEEAKEANRLYDLVCNAFGSTCTGSRTPGRRDGKLASAFTPAPGDPALVLDLNGDGTLQFEEINLVNAPFTTELDLQPEPFNITNSNVAPRISVSWDPMNDGKTRFSASAGRYYDRLFLGTVTLGQQPLSFVAEWPVTGFFNQAEAGESSLPLTGGVSYNQTDRELSTPYTDEIALGFEREIAPEWSVSFLYIHRRGSELLQDVDLNHITCREFDTAYGVDPAAICGDGGGLELDRFGGYAIVSVNTGPGTTPVRSSTTIPNGAVDLYHHNPNFNQILQVDNANASRYEAFDVRLRKRLHRNWEMDAAYTWSRATGEAESFVDLSGNDPAVSDKASGFLPYDQRHVFKLQSVAHLKHEFLLGGTILWESGLPYSVVASVEDYDDTGNLTPQRLFPVSGEKNDQRNTSRLTLSAHIEKRLTLKSCSLSGFLDIENLLDSDDLLLREVDDGYEIKDGERRFGRYLQIGVGVLF